MSNTIDFFQPAQTQLALPCAGVSIMVDGTISTELEPIEIVRSGWPEFSWAKLAYNPAAQAERELIPAEQIERKFAMGRPVRIQQLYDSEPPDTAILGLTIFEGQIETIKTAIDATGEHVEIIARDFSSTLERVTAYGQRADAASGSGEFLAGLDTIFNPDGQPNASPSPREVEGKVYTIFCAEPSQAKFWTLPEVIDYLLGEYVPIGRLHTPGIAQLRALTENQNRSAIWTSRGCV
jgi:hypothetical protein